MPTPYVDQRRAQARILSVKENSARLARSHGSYQTVGASEVTVDGHFDFNLTFVSEPRFTFGAAIDTDSPILQDGNFPRCHALTYDWVQDDNDFYTGAYVAFIVDVPSSDPGYIVNFHVVWEGVSYKDVLRDVDATLVDN